QGTVIAAAGSTGRSSGPHLHFETHFNGAPQNPFNVLPPD
ncbi:MAG TPA: M23 family metallopeptidase, partial [Anaerolineae bacterium]|nr:M23 family metallopeptidase [Anaerolineae bacterium]